MYLIRTLTNRLSTLNAQYLLNKNKNAVRFESQNINWNFQQLNYHGFGLIKGLSSVGLNNNDTFLVRTLPGQQAQTFVTKIGVTGLGAKLIISTATNATQLDKELRQNNISCFLFQPTIQLQNTKLIDTLNTLAPELPSQQHGTPLQLNSYPQLKKLIQTNHYSFPGVYKFKAVMNYTADKYFRVETPQVQAITLPHSNNPIVITNPADDFTFRAAVLNSLVNGRYVHVVQPAYLSEVCAQVYNNKCDVISTTETTLSSEVNVIVEKGSQLFASHKNRIEV